MNISAIAIPQIFYDFIARILPGFFFCVFLFFLLFDAVPADFFASDSRPYETITQIESIDSSGLNKTINTIEKKPIKDNVTFITDLFQSLGYLFIFYFIGIVLQNIVFASEGKKYFSKVDPQKPIDLDDTEFYFRYQRIKIHFPEIGFRIVKIRAEARMMEAIRMGIIVCLILSFGIMLSLYYTNSYQWRWNSKNIFLVFRFVLILLLLIPIFKAEGKYWKRYNDQMVTCYKIIFDVDKEYFLPQKEEEMEKGKKENKNGPKNIKN